MRQDKEKNQEIHLSPLALQPALSEAKTVNSMVQPEQAPKVLSVVVDPQGRYTPEIKATTSVCPSPFKMKPIGLQERYELLLYPPTLCFLFFFFKSIHQLKRLELEIFGIFITKWTPEGNSLSYSPEESSCVIKRIF